jgi:ATP-dependent helicase/nuclease subunit B
MSFLREIAKKILTEKDRSNDELIIILPNKRASVYIQEYLRSHYKKAFFPPRIITINEWINELIPHKILTATELSFILFEVHKKINSDPGDFNDFMKWAKTLLADFDEIDRYMANPADIFSDLRNIKEIENWSFNDTELSEGQKKHLHFWNQIPEYYRLFAEILDSENEIYAGKAYRKIAENPQQFITKKYTYYFIGLNALSTSEETIIRYLLNEKKGIFETENDMFYFQNPNHEAGHFYRKICEKWKIKPTLANNFDTIPKKISIIETANQTGQAQIAGNILNNYAQQNFDLKSTAIVLADESLLIPVLKSLPESIQTANVTMGYPLKFSHIKSLIDLIFEMQFNFQKFNNSTLYHKTILRILDHSYISAIITNQSAINQLEDEIVKHNLVFIDWNFVVNGLKELEQLTPVFTRWEKVSKDGFNAFEILIDKFHTFFQNKKEFETEMEILYHFSQSIERFEKIWKRYPNEMDIKSFKRLFYQFWQNESLSFLGNPIDGIQIMGILETRILDFDNLIIAGMNEGVLPQSIISNSFIPYDLKKHHNLPTDEDHQAVFAHHFYRLIQRSKNISMIYNGNGEDNANSEKSRYITQLLNELNPVAGHSIEFFTYSPDDQNSQTKNTKYPSTEKIHEKLDYYFAEKGLSPSALNKLLQCPLDFYYRYILEMKENDQVEENIESSTFGTKIHDVLEDIFKTNFLEKNIPLQSDILRKEKKQLKSRLNEKYLETFTAEEIKYGQNRLSFEVSLDFLERFIDGQIAEIENSKEPIFIAQLEYPFKTELEFEINGKKKKIILTGLADRIDRTGTLTRIIDYKSGKCDLEKVEIPSEKNGDYDLIKLFDSDKKGYARQLLMYALMYSKSTSDHNDFTAGIISMINLKEWLQNVRKDDSSDPKITSELLNLFEKELKERVSLLYSTDFYFEHNPASKYCEHCNQ